MPNRAEWFRLITPVLVTVALFILADLRADVSKLGDAMVKAKIDIAVIKTKLGINQQEDTSK